VIGDRYYRIGRYWFQWSVIGDRHQKPDRCISSWKGRKWGTDNKKAKGGKTESPPIYAKNVGVTFQRSRTCLGQQSDGDVREREKKKNQEEPSITFFCDTVLAHVRYTVCISACVLKKGDRETFSPLLLASAQHPPQSARWPKPCTNPRSCSLMCPRKHTHTHTLGTHFCTTDFDVINAEHIFPSDTHTHTHARTSTCMRLYFVHSDMRMNRFVKLGLSSHIHRSHGIRCINALCSWICIRQWCATRTEDYFWQTLFLLSLSLSPSPARLGPQLGYTPTCTCVRLRASCWHTPPHHGRMWGRFHQGVVLGWFFLF